MSRESSSGGRICSTLLFFYILASFALLVECQDNTDTNPALTPLITQVIYSRFSNLTTVFEKEIKESLSFCVKNVNDDWNRAFNFSNNMDFLSICVQKTQDLTQRICTAAEIKFYFQSFSGGGSDSTNSVQLNKNCNLASWVPGCEPGWACSVGDNQRVDLKNSKDIPTRGRNCQGCCAGFFCPRGITCMIPCPLGAYCPLAKLNKNTGLCDPYHYQLPPGQPNHTCGGADRWADVRSSRELFCSAGSYCPTTTEEIPCSSGHYCRTGFTSEKKCFKLTSCDPNTTNQNIHAYGALLLAALGTLLLIIYNCSDQVLTTRERRQAKSREAASRSARETARAHERWKAAKMLPRRVLLDYKYNYHENFPVRNLKTNQDK